MYGGLRVEYFHKKDSPILLLPNLLFREGLQNLLYWKSGLYAFQYL